MRAEFDGLDYFLYLDREEGELENLKSKSLTAQLKKSFSDVDLDKLVILSYGENNGPDGIEFVFFPEITWDKLQEARVTINERAYRHIRERGSFGTRYNGSDKIEIFNGLPDRPKLS